MIQISNIKIKVVKRSSNIEILNLALKKVTKKFNLKEQQIIEAKILKKSIDARYDVCYNLQLALQLKNKDLEKEFVTRFPEITNYQTEPLVFTPTKKALKILVVGAGPSGLFNALILSKCAHHVTLIEQGADVITRKQIVEEFWQTGQLNSKTNVQFGEGGAGTFSDGKLNTGTSSKYNQFVLSKFVEYGADPDILIDAKPHIGTDVLINCLLKFREELQTNNVKIKFNHKLKDIEENKRLTAKIINLANQRTSFEEYDAIVLAIGHSAKDTYQMLVDKVAMEPKPFAMGVRIEHLQADIDRVLHKEAYRYLPPANYKLVKHLPNGRTVYSFCMCPGGEVVNASSEEGHLVINGMSYAQRASKYANSALLVNVNVEDFDQGHPLDGLVYQERYEKKAFDLLGGSVIVQKLGDFINQVQTTNLVNKPSIKSAYDFGMIEKCLPKFVAESLKVAISEFDNEIKGFSNPDALLYGIETRSSSPVKIKRNEFYQSSITRVFPIGEGAGYSGGIITSAVDGIKAALAINKIAEELK